MKNVFKRTIGIINESTEYSLSVVDITKKLADEFPGGSFQTSIVKQFLDFAVEEGILDGFPETEGVYPISVEQLSKLVLKANDEVTVTYKTRKGNLRTHVGVLVDNGDTYLLQKMNGKFKEFPLNNVIEITVGKKTYEIS